MSDNDLDEYRRLRKFLKKNDLFEPRMEIENMRSICSMLDGFQGGTQEPADSVLVNDDDAPSKVNPNSMMSMLFEAHENTLQQRHREMAKRQLEPTRDCSDDVQLVQEQEEFVDQTPPKEGENLPRRSRRRLRNRTCAGQWKNKMERHQVRSQTKRNQNQDDEEFRELRQFLEERNMYKDPMDIEEMREVCQAIEQSMKEIDLKPPIAEFEDWTHIEREHRQELTLREDNQNWQANFPNDLNPIMVDYISDQYQVDSTSPPAIPAVVTKSPELIESPPRETIKSPSKTHWILSVPPNVDSDSDTDYSPDKPGPCCKVVHVVTVELHPEPREDSEDDDGLGESPQKAETRLNGSLLPRTVPTDAWDAIDEFF